MTLDPTIFQTTSEFYATYRPPKPTPLFEDIIDYFSLTELGPKDTLLDLGCGTGEMCLPLAKYFEQIEAWDPDAGMLAEARRRAAEADVKHITFAQKSSEDLATVPNNLRVVAMGQSFHWMDNRAVLAQLLPALLPDGGLVIVSGASPTDAPQSEMTNMKNKAIEILIEKYLGPRRRAGKGFYTPSQDDYGSLLTEAGYRDIKEKVYQYILPRTTDEVVGELFSMSWASKMQLGAMASEFEAELRAVLRELSTDGLFEDVIRFSCFYAKK
jgi:ubiquinone/menaquinone biosynthesis C-methylase UbiE